MPAGWMLAFPATTVNHHHRLLHKTLRDAVRQDLILQNPAASAVAPKRTRTRPEIWTEAQTLLFLSEAKASSHHYSVFLFIVGTGVRVGEALGLRWRDLNLSEGVAYITQALQRIRGGGYVIKEPKSTQSYRAINLPSGVVEDLRRLRARQEEDRLRRGLCAEQAQCAKPACNRWHNLGLVFCQPNAKPLHDNNLRQRDLQRICVKLGLAWRRALHNLRHAHGS